MTTRRASGFSLIELMTVVAIVAVLAIIALPSFAEQLRKSRRAEAVGALQDLQLKQERYRVDNASYAPDGTLEFSSASHYAIKVDSASATGYVLTATPQGGQAKDSCGTLTLSSDQGNTDRDPDTGGCW